MSRYLGIIDLKKVTKLAASSSVVRFVAVGGISTSLDFIVYLLLSHFFPVAVSKGTSMIVASLFAYSANKRFTFENKGRTSVRHLGKYYLVFAANLGVNVGINSLVYSQTELKLLAFVIATLCGMTVNYIGQKYYVFRNR